MLYPFIRLKESFMITKIKHLLDKKVFEYILLSLILITGLFVRLYKINNPIADWHSWRQADTASVSKTYMERGIDLLHPRYHDISSIQTGIFNPEGYRMVEFPIYNALNALLAKNFHFLTLEVWARIISIFFALVSALGLYFIGNKFLGRFGGLLSAFFFLLIPYNIYFTRVILPEPLGVAAAIWGLYLFSVYIDGEQRIPLYLSGILFALAFLIKPFFIFYFFPAFYLLIQKYGWDQLKSNKKLLITAISFLSIVFLPLLVWRKWIGQFPEGIPFFEWAFNGDRIRFHPAFWKWIFGERVGHLILGSWGLIPLSLGILSSKVKNQFTNLFLLGMFFYVSVVATANVRHDYYQIIVMPAISLGLASGTLYLWSNQIFNKYVSRIFALFSIFVMLITGWSLVKDNYNVNHPELIEIGREIDQITPKDSLIVAPYNGDTAFLYQMNRWGWPAVDNSIDNIIEEGADYYVSVDLASPDTKKFESMFKTVKKTGGYIILDLHIKNK